MTLKAKISEIVDEFIIDATGHTGEYLGGEETFKDTIRQLLALFEKEMEKIIGRIEIVIENKDLPENVNDDINEGAISRNQLRRSQRTKLAKVIGA